MTTGRNTKTLAKISPITGREKNLDSHDLALSAKLSETVLRDLEGEEIKLAPSLDALFHLARALGVPPAELLKPAAKPRNRKRRIRNRPSSNRVS